MANPGKDDAVSIPIEDADVPATSPSTDAAAAEPASSAAGGAEEAVAHDSETAAEAVAAADEAEAAEAAGQDGAVMDADAAMAAAAEALKAATAEAADWKDKYMRLHAEWDTYRRRTSEQREAERARAAEKLVVSLLPVIDDFERTIDYAEKNGEGELLGGVKAVHSKFVGVLTKDGVEVIDPAGEAFDALEAQAVATVDDASVPDETVHEVYQKGYRLGSKVLRPAMVTVTTGGPKREKPKADEEN